MTVVRVLDSKFLLYHFGIKAVIISKYHVDTNWASVPNKRAGGSCPPGGVGSATVEIKRDAYLQQLIERKDNGMIKVITGIRREVTMGTGPAAF